MAIKSPLRVATCPSWRLMPTGGAACVGDTGWPSKILLTSLRSTICRISGSSCRCGMFFLFQKKTCGRKSWGSIFKEKKREIVQLAPSEIGGLLERKSPSAPTLGPTEVYFLRFERV